MAGGDKGRTVMVNVPSFHSPVEKKWIPQKLHPSHSAQPVCAKEVSQPERQDSFRSVGNYRQLEKSSQKKRFQNINHKYRCKMKGISKIKSRTMKHYRILDVEIMP